MTYKDFTFTEFRQVWNRKVSEIVYMANEDWPNGRQIGMIEMTEEGFRCTPLAYFWGGEETQTEYALFQDIEKEKEFIEMLRNEYIKSNL